MKKILALFTAVLCLLMSSCAADSIEEYSLNKDITADETATYNFVNGQSQSPASYNAFTQCANDFSIKMLSEINKNENTFFASAALYSQLAFLENACDNDAKNQLKKIINNSTSMGDINDSMGYFLSRLNELNPENEYTLNVDNSVFFNEGTVVSTEFLTLNANFYNQNLFRLDYKDENTLNLINSYFPNKTFEKLNPDANLNCVANSEIKDQWLSGYSDEKIVKGKFNNTDIDFLTSTEYYLENENCTGFVKDFKNTPCKFVAILPDENTSINEFTESFNSQKFNEFLNSFNIFKTCKASMPEFKIENKYDFSDALKNLGVTDIFEKNANLGGLSFKEEGQVESILQNNSINITAAGANASKPNITNTVKNEEEYTVTLDRPFLFFIIDNESSVCLFSGILQTI